MSQDQQKFHFISGLPRSGSTLLAAILRQNPRFNASMMSPLALLADNIISQCRAGSELGPLISQEQRKRVIRGLFHSYYQDMEGKEVIFDSNRAWTGRLPLLLDLFPGSKVVCCVRHVGWILDSLERQYRADPYEQTRLFSNDSDRNTVYSRMRMLASPNRLVGFSYQSLKDGFYGDRSESLILVDYDYLTKSPNAAIAKLYEALGESVFEHDFDHVEYEAKGFDSNLGVPGLHKVKPKVVHEERATVLPPDLFKEYENSPFWTDGTNTKATIII